MTIVFIVFVLYHFYKAYFWKCTFVGLMYFAKTEHDWNITAEELKKITCYSMQQTISDFFHNR